VTKYLSVPAFRCNAPSKSTRSLFDAYRHARLVARVFHVPSVLQAVWGGRSKVLRRFKVTPKTA